MIKVNGKEVQFEKFPNGETRLVHESIEKGIGLGYAFPVVHFKFQEDSDLIKLMFVKNYLDSLGSSISSLVIYYMPYSRMDRSENGSAFTLKYVANFINDLCFDEVTVVEPHSDVTTALLDNAKAKFINFDLLPKVMDEVGFDEEYDYIMFPDAGASKRYSKIKARNVLVGNKVRDFDTGKIASLDILGNMSSQPNKVIIADDLSSFGNTFLLSGNSLKELGFSEIYLLVCHSENNIFKGELLKESSPLTKIFTTDSMLTDEKECELNRDKLKVYKIEEVI